MNIENSSSYSQSIKSGLFQILLKRIPPKKFSPHLEDIVNVLMDALSRGELEINLNNKNPQSELKNPGWPQKHKEALRVSGWLEGESTPIVLEENQLSWRRWHNEMKEVVEALIRRSKSNYEKTCDPQKHSSSDLQGVLNKDQQIAVEMMETQGVILLSGGPGTGKTSTVMRMLERALCLNHDLNIGLAAPTGKATRRLQESLQLGIASITSPHKQALSKIPCNTLHKWLQARPSGFGRGTQNPLTLDLLVIDEMSMVDLSLMKALLKALPENSQLVLVGDPDQLPPIGSGAVWHQLQRKDIRIHFGRGAIHLQKHYRNRGELASLSKTLCKEGIGSFWENLSQLPQSANIKTHQYKMRSIPPLLVQRLQNHSKRLEQFTQNLVKEKSSGVKRSDISNNNIGKAEEDLFSCLEELMILCPTRYGPCGVDEVHRTFLRKNGEEGLSKWPQGTPVMCTKNQPELQLSNGDIGIVIGEGDNRRLLFRVFSEEGNLSIRYIHPARLKKVEPALAMTIHKAQGSETNEVILLLPKEYSQSLHAMGKQDEVKSYEERLLYTAITRAKSKVNLILMEEG